jgi:isochorismate pyruvate lyase
MNQLADLRQKIDALDAALIKLLAERAGCVQQVAHLKKRDNLPARIPERVDEVIAKVRAAAAEQEIDPELAEHLWRAIIEWSIKFEETALKS